MGRLRRFGLIGHPVGHSWSARYFKAKWEREGITDCVYGLHDVETLEALPALWNDPDWAGMNVTIPHKKAIMPMLDGISPDAEAIGAVNVVAFTGEGRIGHNTDAEGFKRSIAPFLEGHHHRALILGTGGSAAAVRHVLQEIGVDTMLVSRHPEGHGQIGYGDITREGIATTPVIINCSPVGMHPDILAVPPLGRAALEGLGPDHLVVDLIYNPTETAFLRTASELGARTLGGQSMLELQAEAAWSIWCAERP